MGNYNLQCMTPQYIYIMDHPYLTESNFMTLVQKGLYNIEVIIIYTDQAQFNIHNKFRLIIT